MPQMHAWLIELGKVDSGGNRSAEATQGGRRSRDALHHMQSSELFVVRCRANLEGEFESAQGCNKPSGDSNMCAPSPLSPGGIEQSLQAMCSAILGC